MFEINEILSKSKSSFVQLPKYPEQIKVFPEDPPDIKPEISIEKAMIMRKSKVTLNRLNMEDEELMQKSLTEFAKKSPELARQLGVIKDDSDTFSQMKADGKLCFF